MIPQHWLEYRREDDDELIGYLSPGDESDGVYTPMTVFGYPLGDAGVYPDAVAALESTGLSYLADRWTLRLDGAREPIAVQIVEANPDRLTVKNVDYGHDGNIGDLFTLEVPVSQALSR
ncbi:hypothetical protein [Spelaeicoccus albus]|uniref:Uncharacterized protein n=1 Tax=Spelaeicoccus albus TaxID=1280376 RepID=A0A7Z0D2F2_9MICO|nr:hypothetical protein [Spelaeicoccus albus]NYI67620.1 hypothetical protein [Spelaeicoccus albus]